MPRDRNRTDTHWNVKSKELTKLQLRRRTVGERGRVLLCFSGNWRAKFSKMLPLAC